MKGYKLIPGNWVCQIGEWMPHKDMYGEEELRWIVRHSQKYAVGETAVVEGRPILGEWGLHFCTDMADCLDFKELTPEMHMCEVEALGEISRPYYPYDSTRCTNKLKIIREIPFKELMQHIAEYGLLEKDPSLLQYVKQQTEDVCLTAVQEDGCALRYVRQQTEDICVAAVRQRPGVIMEVRKQTPKICLTAVQQDPWMLQEVENQTEEICRAAVQGYGQVLKYVRQQTPEICLEAVQNYGMALKYVIDQTPEICLAAVSEDWKALQFVKEQTEEICKTATGKDPRARKFIRNRSLMTKITGLS